MSNEDPIYAFVLSMTSDFRSESLRSDLESIGITVITIFGPKPEHTYEKYKLNKLSWFRRESLSPAHRACTLGHNFMFKRAMELGVDFALFFEDDAEIDKNYLLKILSVYQMGTHQLPRVLLLGSCGGLSWRKRHVLPSFEYRNVFENAINGAHAYIARTEGIRYLFNGSKAMHWRADGFKRPRKCGLAIAYPFAAWQKFGVGSLIYQDSTRTFPSSLNSETTHFRNIKLLGLDLARDIFDFLYFRFFGNRILAHFRKSKIVKFFILELPGCRNP